VEGKLNPSDAPSRHPLPSTADPTGARLSAESDPVQPVLPVVRFAAGQVLTEYPSEAELAAALGVKVSKSVLVVGGGNGSASEEGETAGW